MGDRELGSSYSQESRTCVTFTCFQKENDDQYILGLMYIWLYIILIVNNTTLDYLKVNKSVLTKTLN
jgi:hypothetical protein